MDASEGAAIRLASGHKEPTMTFARLTLAAFLALGPLAAAAQDTTRTSVDWDGQYVGVIPCADCPGIEMVLELHGDGTYRLAETYQEKGEKPFIETGSFTWGKDGSTITLDDEDNRAFFVSEGAVEMVGADGKPNGGDYRLEKARVMADAPAGDTAQFVGDGQQLLIEGDSVEKTTVNGAEHVTFAGTINFEHRMEGGHKSLLATFDIDCKARTVDMPSVAYYKDENGGGDELHATGDNAGNALPLVEDGDDVIRQAADQLCR